MRMHSFLLSDVVFSSTLLVVCLQTRYNQSGIYLSISPSMGWICVCCCNHGSASWPCHIVWYFFFCISIIFIILWKNCSIINITNEGYLDSYTELVLVFHPRRQICGGSLPCAFLLVNPTTVIAAKTHVGCVLLQVQFLILEFLSSSERTVYHHVLVLQFHPILVQMIGSFVSSQSLVVSTSCLLLRLWFSSQK